MAANPEPRRDPDPRPDRHQHRCEGCRSWRDVRYDRITRRWLCLACWMCVDYTAYATPKDNH